MGCGASKGRPPDGPGDDPLLAAQQRKNPPSPTRDEHGRRVSVEYVSKELMKHRSTSQVSSMTRRSSAPFDRDRIGTHTRHGIAPGPTGRVKAKINQDRGCVVWPFNGSYDQALMCVFDGHGLNGEKVSEYCVHKVTELLVSDEKALDDNPAEALRRSIIDMDKQLFASELRQTAMTGGCTCAAPRPLLQRLSYETCRRNRTSNDAASTRTGYSIACAAAPQVCAV